jgi:hypothetical protein
LIAQILGPTEFHAASFRRRERGLGPLRHDIPRDTGPPSLAGFLFLGLRSSTTQARNCAIDGVSVIWPSLATRLSPAAARDQPSGHHGTVA